MDGHDHGAAGHSHGAGNERAIGIAALLTGTFMFAEVIGGIVSGSLALLADAGHMLTLHVAGDLLGSVAALVASLVIIYTGWTPIDPLLSVFVVLIILKSAWAVVRESGHILLEGAPRGLDSRAVAKAIVEQIPAVTRAHHIHAWSITQERPMITLEADVAPGTDVSAAKTLIKDLLEKSFGMAHATVEINVT